MESRYLPYFRPTRKKHSSGYLCFEVGYCMEDSYMPIACCSDVIHLYDLLHCLEPNDWLLNIDSVDYNYFRIFGGKEVHWQEPVMSSAILVEGPPDYAELERRWKEYELKEKTNGNTK